MRRESPGMKNRDARRFRRLLGQVARNAEACERLRREGFLLADMSDGDAERTSEDPLSVRAFPLDPAHFESSVHPDDLPAYRVAVGRLLTGDAESLSLEYRRRASDGRWFWTESCVRVLTRKASGGVGIYADLQRDIEYRKAETNSLRERLEEEERRYALAETLRSVSLASSTQHDAEKTVEDILEEAREFIPFESAEVHAIEEGRFIRIGAYPPGGPPQAGLDMDEPRKRVAASLKPIVQDADGNSDLRSSWMGVPLILRGEILGVLELWHSAAGAFKGERIWSALAFGDTLAVFLAERRRYTCLVEEARTDPLTGLYGRRFFDERCESLLQAFRENGCPVSLILLDIDRFKLFNDKYGHLLGDEVLRVVAEVLRRTLRREDLICRFGGEEFVALLPGVPLSIALDVAERIRAGLEARRIHGVADRVTASFGVAECQPERPEALRSLIVRADRALYRAKEGGRNRVTPSAGPEDSS